jgi:hypothetical protein
VWIGHRIQGEVYPTFIVKLRAALDYFDEHLKTK